MTLYEKDIETVRSIALGYMDDCGELTNEIINDIESAYTEEDIIIEVIDWDPKFIILYIEDKDKVFYGRVTLEFDGNVWKNSINKEKTYEKNQ
ncbi:hypothetical protein B4102_2145 [Heyndrickxia sporothermodurans]|uniref:Uncharacterized protein n=1 Tax=Heyndrickxia sporothermodurans TaxID=46224 RepID=A0A150LGG8_9BACI|nr:hypothetical protein [Heyndrickxia sporothermodurans]KYD11417.1 hypothetical protein B4102_2145 [Heyndrickxia sporothermodurans]